MDASSVMVPLSDKTVRARKLKTDVVRKTQRFHKPYQGSNRVPVASIRFMVRGWVETMIGRR